jgi:hypothetical protein
VSPDAVKDIEDAIRLAPGYGNMHSLAVILWCCSDREDRRDRALQHAEKAIELGYDAQRFRHVPHLPKLVGKERMDVLLSSSPPQALLPDPPPFLDPDPAPKELQDF